MGLRVDDYDKKTELYEVYSYTEKLQIQKSGKVETIYLDTECFTCDCNGKIEKHEVWSEMFDEYRAAPIPKDERKNFPAIFENIEKQLAEAIKEYNLDDENHEPPCYMTLAKAQREDRL